MSNVLTAVQVADLWIGAGGPRSRAVEWVAIAIGESSLDADATSPVGAAGLWQIMPFNAGPYGYTPGQLYDPAVNAHIAVAMSGGGTNCAAWDSCYLDIQASGRYAFLSWPEQGSADWNNLATAQAELTGHGLTGTTDPGYPGISGSLAATVAQIQAMADGVLPALAVQTAATAAATAASFKRGWRPSTS